MEICFSHIANYLRVVTSLTVLDDNEWLIGHSSRRHGVLRLLLSFRGRYLFVRLCWVFCCCCCSVCVFTLAPALHVHVCAFLEVTGNVINGCEAGSVVKGTWLVFVSTMIPWASKCWRIVFAWKCRQWACSTGYKWLILLANEPRLYVKSRFFTPCIVRALVSALSLKCSNLALVCLELPTHDQQWNYSALAEPLFSAVDSSGVQLGRGTVSASVKVALRPEAQSTATLSMYATYLSEHH